MNIPTAHINCADINDIAKTVIMPGDPLRAKFIAENFLTDYKQINNVRNMFGYTGTYKGKKVTVMGSGMGMPSIGIYSYELYAFYGVETIIRVGSAGSYSADLNLFDIVLVKDAYSESTFAGIVTGEETNVLPASSEVNDLVKASAKNLNIEIIEDTIHSSDVFYRKNFDDFKTINREHGCVCVEMESFALFANAKALGKKAACVLTISDSLVKDEATTSEQRETGFVKMMELALDAIEGE
jgi:purine-nucleoside phosphorylase